MALDDTFFRLGADRRGLDQTLLDQLRAQVGRQGRSIGASMFNRTNRQLTQGGLQRSAVKFAAPQRAAGAESDFLFRNNLALSQQNQNAVESNRRFDMNKALAMKQLFIQNKLSNDKRKFNAGQFAGNLVQAGGTIAGAAIA